MEYREITIHTASTGIEIVSNELIALGVGGFEIVDSADFKEFLEPDLMVTGQELFTNNAKIAERLTVEEQLKAEMCEHPFLASIEPVKKNQYGQYLLDVLNGTYMAKLY